MGRGDVKTKRGKISMGSFGVSRPHEKKKVEVVAKTKKTATKAKAKAKPKAAAKKADTTDKKKED